MKKLIITSCLLLSSLTMHSQDKKPTAKCQAFTKTEKQCSRNAVTETGYCKQHDPAAVRCAGKTKERKPCHLIPKEGEVLCYHHKVK